MGVLYPNNKYSLQDVMKYAGTDWNETVKTIEDVKILLSFGWEFEAQYNGVRALITNNGSYYCDADESDDCFYDDIDEFGEKAKWGDELLKDVVGKWEIVTQQA